MPVEDKVTANNSLISKKFAVVIGALVLAVCFCALPIFYGATEAIAFEQAIKLVEIVGGFASTIILVYLGLNVLKSATDGKSK